MNSRNDAQDVHIQPNYFRSGAGCAAVSWTGYAIARHRQQRLAAKFRDDAAPRRVRLAAAGPDVRLQPV